MSTSEIAPHDCPACGQPAYVGLNEVQCTCTGCRNYHEATAAYHNGSQRDLVVPAGGRKGLEDIISIKVDPSTTTGFGTPLVFGQSTNPRVPKVTANLNPLNRDDLIDGIEQAFPGVYVKQHTLRQDMYSTEIDITIAVPRLAPKAVPKVTAKRNAKDPKRLDVEITVDAPTRVGPYKLDFDV